jgi:hypothetical protein
VRGYFAAQNLEKSVLDGRIPKALRELVLSELISSHTVILGKTNSNLRMLRREKNRQGGLILNQDNSLMEI